MTPEEKAKAYDKAIEQLKEIFNCKEVKVEALERPYLEKLFPELKENSEDEKIRKALLNYLTKMWGNSQDDICGVHVEDAIAWLEKQGEQSIYKTPSREIILAIWDLGNEWKELTKSSISTEYGTQLDYIQKHWQESEYYLRAKQSEQKPFDYESADIQNKDFAPESTPRYSIGDVLCDKSCTTLNKESQSNFEIIDIRNGMYICDKCSFPISQQDEYELVAKRIEQKPYSQRAECLDCQFNYAGECKGSCAIKRNEQKTAWNEEDEKRLRSCLNILQAKFGTETINTKWLKSLKNRLL